MNLLLVAALLALRWIEAESERSLHRDIRAIVTDWDQ